MIKTVVIGLWVCIIALGSLMAAIKVGSTPKPAAAAEETAPTVDFDRTDVKQKIIDGVNQRFPEPVIKDIMVEQFNYIPADQVRDMNKVK